MCGLEIEIEGAKVLRIRGDEKDPLSRGHICPKALALTDLHEDPDRVRTPLRKTASGDFEPISWELALDEVAARIHDTQVAHGRDAVAAYIGNPNVHNLGTLIFAPSFLRTLRSKNRYSATSVDQLPAMLASYLMYGHQLLLPIPDIERTRELLIVGANPLASNGSIMSAGDVRGRLKAIQAEGGHITVVDPRRTLTARMADDHVFIRPGTDAALLLAVLQHGLDAHGPQLGRMARHVDGVDELRKAIREFTPSAVEACTGVPADKVRELADRLWGSDRSAVYARVGACVQAFGGLTMWAVNLLNLMCGAFDREGGVMFPEPAVDLVDAPPGFGVGKGSFGRWRSRVRGLPEFGGELPASCLAEEITTPGDGRVRALITVAGNPVLSTPNGRALDSALEHLEFMVSVDMYVNATTRHADIILPPTSQLERSHYDLVFNAFAVRNVAKWSPPAIEAPAGARHDWQILQALHRRLLTKRGAPLTVRSREALLERMGPDRLLDLALRLGRRGSLNPLAKGVNLARLKDAPHGVDLGPLRPCMPGRLPAHQKRVDLVPSHYLEDLPRLQARVRDEARASLVLINRRDLRSNNSWMHNVEKLVKGPPRCALEIHPDDAAARGIADGDMAKLATEIGAIELPAKITDDVMRGVVCVPHGYGHGREGVRMRVASAHAGVSVNDVMDHEQLDPLSGVAVLTGQSVTVSAATA